MSPGMASFIAGPICPPCEVAARESSDARESRPDATASYGTGWGWWKLGEAVASVGVLVAVVVSRGGGGGVASAGAVLLVPMRVIALEAVAHSAAASAAVATAVAMAVAMAVVKLVLVLTHRQYLRVELREVGAAHVTDE